MNKISEPQERQKSVSVYLDIDIIQKLLQRLLIEKKKSREELAKLLEITKKDVDELLNKKSKHLIPKVNLPLIELYCETDFQEEKKYF